MNTQEIVVELMLHGLTQTQIAEKTGFSQPTISDVANGKVGLVRPSHEMMTKLQALHAEVLASAA